MKKLCILIASIIAIAIGQPTVEWENFFGRGGGDYLCTIYENAVYDNMVYSCGWERFDFDQMHDWHFIMTDLATGEIIKDSISAWADTVEDEFHCITIADNKVWCAGRCWGTPVLDRYRGLIESFDLEGNGISRIIYGQGEGLTFMFHDCIYDGYGQIGIAGEYTEVATLTSGVLFQRRDRNGYLVKSVTYDDVGSQSGRAITFSNSAYYIGGSDRNAGLIMKIENDQIRWCHRIEREYRCGITDVAWNQTLNKLICVGWVTDERLNSFIWLLQVTAGGQVEFDTILQITDCQRASSVSIDTMGYYFIGGSILQNGLTCGLLLKVDFQGNVIWDYTVPSVCECMLYDVLYVGNNEILVAGINDDKGYVAKLSEGVGITERKNPIITESGIAKDYGIYDPLGRKVGNMHNKGIYFVKEGKRVKKIVNIKGGDEE